MYYLPRALKISSRAHSLEITLTMAAGHVVSLLVSLGVIFPPLTGKLVFC